MPYMVTLYHQYTPVMLAYIPYMDPMGNGKSIYKWMMSKWGYPPFFRTPPYILAKSKFL